MQKVRPSGIFLLVWYGLEEDRGERLPVAVFQAKSRRQCPNLVLSPALPSSPTLGPCTFTYLAASRVLTGLEQKRHTAHLSVRLRRRGRDFSRL